MKSINYTRLAASDSCAAGGACVSEVTLDTTPRNKFGSAQPYGAKYETAKAMSSQYYGKDPDKCYCACSAPGYLADADGDDHKIDFDSLGTPPCGAN